MLTHLLMLVALVLPAEVSHSQGVPDLSGTWVMVADKSSFGPMPAPQSRTDIIEHKGQSLTIKRTQMTQNGEVTSTLVYGIDGKPYKNKAGDNDVTSILNWDGAVLVVQSTVTTPGGDANVVDRFTLSADTKTLTQSRTISIQGQEIAQTIVLAKQ